MAVRSDPRIGTELAGYRLDAVVGRGGMSVVYRAEHLRLGRTVALKLLTAELAEDERFRDRFLRESRMAAALDHPNIIPIYDADEAEGVLYIAMRYVEGADLKGLLGREGALAPERAISIVAQIGGALDTAHAQGLVHRDVKPGNVLLAPDDHAYLCDFGLSKAASSNSGLTATGQFIGTLDYVAPEQIRGEQMDGRADLYSLGCMLYECLAGSPPYKRDTEVAVLWAHVQDDPPSPHSQQPQLPAELDTVIATALAKSPNDRYQSGKDLSKAAWAALEGEIQTVPSRKPPVRRDTRKRLVTLAAIAASVLAVAVGLFIALGREGEQTEDGNQPSFPTTSDAGAIVLGQSIGPVQLGMTEDEVVRVLGEPPTVREWTSRGKTGSTATYTLHDAGFRVSYFEGEVVQVMTKSPYYRTSTGIAVGARPPDPLDPEARAEALRTGELVQVGKDRYTWRGFVHDGGNSYCVTGHGAVTVLFGIPGGVSGISDLSITRVDFVPDLAFEVSPPPCASRI